MGLVSAFISYRTSDTHRLAETIAESLKHDLGASAVYFAPTDNQPLIDWVQGLEEHLEQSQVVVALIGPNWSNCPPDSRHGGCIHDDTDWVRREVSYGLNDPDTTLLPVFVGISGIDADDLPADVSGLGRTHGIVLADAAIASDDYQRMLTACWLSVRELDDRTILVVSDGTDEASLVIDELLAALADEDLIEASELSITANDPFGMRAIPLRDAAKKWPGVIVVAPRTPTEIFAARVRALAELRGVKEVALVGASLATAETGLFGTAGTAIETVAWREPKKLASSMRAGWRKSFGVGAKIGLAGGVMAAASLGIVAVRTNGDDGPLIGYPSLLDVGAGHMFVADQSQNLVAAPLESNAALRRLPAIVDRDLDVDDASGVVAYTTRSETLGNLDLMVISTADWSKLRIPIDINPQEVIVVPGGATVAMHNYSELHLVDVNKGTQTTIDLGAASAPGLDVLDFGFRRVAFSPDGTTIAVDRNGLDDGWAVDFIDVESLEILHRYGPLPNGSWGAGFDGGFKEWSRDGSRYVLMTQDQTIEVFDAETHDFSFGAQIGDAIGIWDAYAQASPDASSMAVEGGLLAEQVCILDLMTVGLECFDTPPRQLLLPTWSHDADLIVAHARCFGSDCVREQEGFWAIDPDTGDSFQIFRHNE